VSSTCIGCGTCVLICPTDVIKLKDVIGNSSKHDPDPEGYLTWCRLCSDSHLPIEDEIIEESYGYVFGE
jgi:Fe-S-cluster-containing hydrogenase component 2